MAKKSIIELPNFVLEVIRLGQQLQLFELQIEMDSLAQLMTHC